MLGRNAGSLIHHSQANDSGAFLQRWAKLQHHIAIERGVALGRAPMSLRVFKQIAHGAAQQFGNARNPQHRVHTIQPGAGMRAFLGTQGHQIHQLYRTQVGLLGIEPAGEQNFTNQLIELADIALQLLPQPVALAAALQQLQPHAQARKRRTQLVGRIGEQRFLRFQQSITRLHQRLQSLRGIVEALRQKCGFIITLHRRAHAQIAVTPGLDASLQILQSPGQTPDHRVGSQRDRQSHQAQGGHITHRTHPGRPIRARYVDM